MVNFDFFHSIIEELREQTENIIDLKEEKNDEQIFLNEDMPSFKTILENEKNFNRKKLRLNNGEKISLLPDLSPEPLSKLFDISSLTDRNLEYKKDGVLPKKNTLPAIKKNQDEPKIKDRKNKVLPKNVLPELPPRLSEFTPILPVIPKEVVVKNLDSLNFQDNLENKKNLSKEPKVFQNKNSFENSNDLDSKFFDYLKFHNASVSFEEMHKILDKVLSRRVVHNKEFIEKSLICNEEILKNLEKIKIKLYAKV